MSDESAAHLGLIQPNFQQLLCLLVYELLHCALQAFNIGAPVHQSNLHRHASDAHKTAQI